MADVTVVGAGLAGSEAAWQLARRGVSVKLLEMKPGKRTPAHVSDGFAELVCSNSLRSNDLTNAVGLLKEEMRRFDSLIISCADATRVEAGGALAVDRVGFSRLVTERLLALPANVDQEVYVQLCEAAFPATTSGFNLWQEEVRAYLEALGLPRYRLMEMFGADDAAVAAEFFGFERVGLTAHVAEYVRVAAGIGHGGEFLGRERAERFVGPFA